MALLVSAFNTECEDENIFIRLPCAAIDKFVFEFEAVDSVTEFKVKTPLPSRVAITYFRVAITYFRVVITFDVDRASYENLFVAITFDFDFEAIDAGSFEEMTESKVKATTAFYYPRRYQSILRESVCCQYLCASSPSHSQYHGYSTGEFVRHERKQAGR